MIIFTLCFNFISALNILQTSTTTNIDLTTSANNIFSQISGFSGGIEYVWVSILTIAGISSFILAKILNSVSIIGVYLLSAVFWTSFNRCLAFININNFIPSELLTIIIVPLLFIWVAAIIGMFTILQ